MRADTPIQSIDFNRIFLYDFCLTEYPQTLFNNSVLFVLSALRAFFIFDRHPNTMPFCLEKPPRAETSGRNLLPSLIRLPSHSIF